jgi:predicted membrane protein
MIMNKSLKLKFFEIVARVQHRKPMKKMLESVKADATAITMGPWFAASAVVVVVVDMATKCASPFVFVCKDQSRRMRVDDIL